MANEKTTEIVSQDAQGLQEPVKESEEPSLTKEQTEDKYNELKKENEELRKRINEQLQELSYYRTSFQNLMFNPAQSKEINEADLEKIKYEDPELYEKKKRELDMKILKQEISNEIKRMFEIEKIERERRELQKKYSDFAELEPKIAQRISQPLTLEDYYILTVYPTLKDKIKKEVEEQYKKSGYIKNYPYIEGASGQVYGSSKKKELSDIEKKVAAQFGLTPEQYAKRKEELGIE